MSYTPRSRIIKPSFFMNERLAECDPRSRLFFAGLWTLADREGRLEYRPKLIRVHLFPHEPEVDIDVVLQPLVPQFVQQYEINGVVYLAIIGWKEHQKCHYKEVASQLPAPPPLPRTQPELNPSLIQVQSVVASTTKKEEEQEVEQEEEVRPKDHGLYARWKDWRDDAEMDLEALAINSPDIPDGFNRVEFFNSVIEDLDRQMMTNPDKFTSTNFMGILKGYLKKQAELGKLGDGGMTTPLSAAKERTDEDEKRLRAGSRGFKNGSGVKI